MTIVTDAREELIVYMPPKRYPGFLQSNKNASALCCRNYRIGRIPP